jgi:hypothetical protein
VRLPLQAAGTHRQTGHGRMVRGGLTPSQSGFDPWGFNPWGFADPCLMWAAANGFDPSVCHGSIGGGGGGGGTPDSTPYPHGPGGNQTQCTLCTVRQVVALAKCANYGGLAALFCMGVAQRRYIDCTRRHCT